jgi:hypothetical protein
MKLIVLHISVAEHRGHEEGGSNFLAGADIVDALQAKPNGLCSESAHFSHFLHGQRFRLK